jgi:hypothetical protein
VTPTQPSFPIISVNFGGLNQLVIVGLTVDKNTALVVNDFKKSISHNHGLKPHPFQEVTANAAKLAEAFRERRT